MAGAVGIEQNDFQIGPENGQSLLPPSQMMTSASFFCFGQNASVVYAGENDDALSYVLFVFLALFDRAVGAVAVLVRWRSAAPLAR